MPTKLNNNYYIKLLLLLSCVMSISSLATEDKSPTEINSNTSTAAEDKTPAAKPVNKPAPQQQSTNKSQSPSRFKPSEEISEDYSVPFPVDI